MQGDRKRELGLPCSAIRDRSRVDVPSAQVSALLQECSTRACATGLSCDSLQLR